MVLILDSQTNERLWADMALPLPNFTGRQLQIDIRVEDHVLTHLYYIDAIERDMSNGNGVVYVTAQKSYLDGQPIQ